MPNEFDMEMETYYFTVFNIKHTLEPTGRWKCSYHIKEMEINSSRFQPNVIRTKGATDTTNVPIIPLVLLHHHHYFFKRIFFQCFKDML